MQIVINIPEKHYRMTRDGMAYKSNKVLEDAFKRATILPEYNEQEIFADGENKEMKEEKDPTTLDFLNFLYNTINPNEMEQYIRMFQAVGIPTNGE